MLQSGALAVWPAPYLGPAASRGVKPRAPPRGIAIKKLLRRVVSISCASTARLLRVLASSGVAAETCKQVRHVSEQGAALRRRFYDPHHAPTPYPDNLFNVNCAAAVSTILDGY